ADRAQAPKRDLVGGVVVRVPPREQALGQRLQHDAHADVDLAQGGQIALAHEPGIGVGQERRLLQRELAHRAEVAERGAMSVALEELAVLGEARLRPIAQREERLLGAEAGAGLRERHDLVRRQRARSGLAGIAPERAVATVVATQRGQRHEDLRREGDGTAASTVAQLAGSRQQLGQRLAGALDQLARRRVGDHRWRRTGRAALRVAGRACFAAFGLAVFLPRERNAGATSLAKRVRLARTASRSWWVESKTKCVTPTSA